MPIIPILAGGAVVGIVALLVKRAMTLRFKVYQAGNETWVFSIYRGEKLLFTSSTDTPFANAGAAATAAKSWIAANPNAGKNA